MERLLNEILFIAALIFVNGYLSGTEIAVVTARKSHIKELAERGNRRAIVFLKLKEEPDRFLATIQIGITGVGVLASAVGRAAAIKVIEPFLHAVPIKVISLAAEPIAIGIVVVTITYFSVIFGELVPKSIALRHPETIGLWSARTVDAFSKINAIFVKILTWSTALVLKPFGSKPFTERTYVTEEEVKMLIKEGGRHGVFEPTEERLLQSVFEFTEERIFDEAGQAARDAGVELTLPGLAPRNTRKCEFVEGNSAFISWDGNVHRCYFLWHRYACYVGGVEKRVKPWVFGNVHARDILSIWKDAAPRSFREHVTAYKFPFCFDCGFALCDYVGEEEFEQDCYIEPVPCGACLWCTGLFHFLQ